MNTMFGGAFLIGIVTAAWGKIKGILSRLWSIPFASVTVYGHLATAVKGHCWTHYKRNPYGQRLYSSDRVHVRPLRKMQSVPYELLSTDPVIFWNGWRPILVGARSDGNTGGGAKQVSAIDGVGSNIVTMTFIRGTIDIDKFLVEAMDEFNRKLGCEETKVAGGRKRFFIRRLIGSGGMKSRIGLKHNQGESGPGSDTPVAGNSSGISIDAIETGELRILKWGKDEIGPELSVSPKALDALAFPENVKRIIIDLDHWLKSDEWYWQKQIPWTRGGNIYGPPGTGKTSLVRGIGQDFDLPVFTFDLGSMSNEEFCRYWNEMQGHAPCIALMEDIDGVFHGRQNILGESGGGLTFDCFLNMLGGIENANGVFKVITTNDIDRLDPALGKVRPLTGNEEEDDASISTRPGRMDWAIELTLLEEHSRRQIAERILSDCTQFIEPLVEKGKGDTGAQFQERCAKVALREHWKNKESDELVRLGFQPQKIVPALPPAVAESPTKAAA